MSMHEAKCEHRQWQEALQGTESLEQRSIQGNLKAGACHMILPVQLVLKRGSNHGDQ